MSKSNTCSEGNEEVVTAEDRAEAHAEDSKKKVEDNESRLGNISLRSEKRSNFVRTSSNDEAEADAENTLPEDRYQKPLFDCFKWGCISDSDIGEWKRNAIITCRFR
jgi:hypothetical protein